MKMGATALAEGLHDYKVDVNLIFGGKEIRKCVLRTTHEDMTVWKARNNSVSMSPFEGKNLSQIKKSAWIDGEVWVYRIDATKPEDIVTAVKIAAPMYKIRADELLGNVYVKNLNAEGERSLDPLGLVRANKTLYQKTCEAIRAAAKSLGIKESLNLWVISKNNNPKIPQEELHDALKKGGGSNVKTDTQRYKFWSGSNNGEDSRYMLTNLHYAGLTPE